MWRGSLQIRVIPKSTSLRPSLLKSRQAIPFSPSVLCPQGNAWHLVVGAPQGKDLRAGQQSHLQGAVWGGGDHGGGGGRNAEGSPDSLLMTPSQEREPRLLLSLLYASMDHGAGSGEGLGRRGAELNGMLSPRPELEGFRSTWELSVGSHSDREWTELGERGDRKTISATPGFWAKCH